MMKARQINWNPLAGMRRRYLFLIVYQILLLIGLPFYFHYATIHTGTVIASVVLLFLTGLGITGGYHRFYSHRTFRANWFVEWLVFFFGSMAGQSSILRWSFDHRLHHAHVDTDDDPYSIKKGFWYAHFGWIADEPRPIDPKVVPDLLKNKLVMFQERHIGLCMLITNAIAFVTVGALFGDYLGAFVLALWLRLFTLHHVTWFINSLAHTWGDRPFSQEQSAVNNYILSLLTFGEGYHNYHHTFANDYRNGVRWYHYDPTKWLIWTLNKLGLAHDLKKMSPYAIKRKMVLEHRNLLIEQITSYWQGKREDLEQKVQEVSARLVEKISNFGQLKERYYQMKQAANIPDDMLKSLRQEMKALKKSMRADLKEWSQLSDFILRRRAVPQLQHS